MKPCLRLRALILAVLLGSSAAAFAQAGSTLTLRDNSQAYEITAKTSADITNALRQHGLVSATESGYRSSYVWQLAWTLTPRTDAQGCHVGDLAVKLTSISTEPHWAAPNGTPANLSADWMRYLAALRSYQAKQRNLTLGKAQTLKPRVAKLVAKTCDSLQRGIDFLGQQLIEDMHKANDDLDRSTRHGETEGVRWPPVKVAPAKPAPAPAKR